MKPTFRVGATIATISFLAWFGLGFLLRALDVISSDELAFTWGFVWVVTLLPLGFVIPLLLKVWRSKVSNKNE